MFHRRGVLGFLAGAIAGVAGATYYTLFRRPLPQTRGRIRLSGLEAEVLVVRDRWGIPHLYAHSLRDLFFAQGFVHAQDRFFQMEFQRRLASGRLSEVLGPKALEVDRWMRIVGLRRAADREVATLSDRAREALLAYAEGVNAFLSRGRLPAEFSFLRYRPEHWVIADSLAWLKMMAWMLSINWEAEVLRARLIARLGPERAARLDPSPAADTPTI
ncbi:MAG: penicillin acylase family protein, partial [Chloroflexi bacterium]